MDPQLAKLMARRRRKADGDDSSALAGDDGTKGQPSAAEPPLPTLPGSPPFSGRKSESTATATVIASPSSVSMTRRTSQTPEDLATLTSRPTTPSQRSSSGTEVAESSEKEPKPDDENENGDGDGDKDGDKDKDNGDEEEEDTVPTPVPTKQASRTTRISAKRQLRLSVAQLSELDALVSAVDASMENEEETVAAEPLPDGSDGDATNDKDPLESNPSDESKDSSPTSPNPSKTPVIPSTSHSHSHSHSALSGNKPSRPTIHTNGLGYESGPSSPSPRMASSPSRKKLLRRKSGDLGSSSGHRRHKSDSRRSPKLERKISGDSFESRGNRLRRSPPPEHPDALEAELLAATSAAADAIGGRSPPKPVRRQHSSGSKTKSPFRRSSASGSTDRDGEDEEDHRSLSGDESESRRAKKSQKPSMRSRQKSMSPDTEERKETSKTPVPDRFGMESSNNYFETNPKSIDIVAELSSRPSKKKNDAFPADFGNFSADFGSFADTKSSTPSGTPKARDNFSDPFGISGSMDYEPPSFNLSMMDFGGSAGGWGKPPPKVYDKSPIDKPPVNRVESMSTKIKWITPRSNMIVSSLTENENPAPATNPLTGNTIVCRPGSNHLHNISEWDPQRKTQVLGTSIFTSDLKRKVVEKFNAIPDAVERVWTVTAGAHRAPSKEKDASMDAVRVAVLLDLTILGERFNEVLRVIVVWNWGDNIQIQSVLSPPSGADFTYDTECIVVADGCVFVAGASAKGPCVFLNKPTVRETWSANFIAKNNPDFKITHMAATNCPKSPPDPDSASSVVDHETVDGERVPYLAIALDDGSLSVWTYEAATRLNATNTEAVRKLLFPLCRLHAHKVLQTCPVTTWSSKEQTTVDGDRGSNANVGHCTHLEWIPYRASSHKQLLLLAASFQGALCLYHVALPKLQDKSNSSKKGTYIEIRPPNEKTILGQTISVKPFCYSKWTKTYHKSSCSFVDLGPHVPPSLVVLLTGSDSNADYAKMALVTSPLPAHTVGKSKPMGDHLAFHVWDTHEWTKRESNLPRGLITSSLSSTRGIMYYTNTSIEEIEYRTNTRFQHGVGGVGSIPVGLTTSGSNYWADSTTASGTGVLSIYTTLHCERVKSTLSPDPSSPTLLEWTAPTRRHWLVQTFAADSKGSTPVGAKSKTSREEKEGDDVVVLGGAQSTVLCELVTQSKLHNNLFPYRVSRNPYSSEGDGSSGTQHIAVWFRPLYGHSDSSTIGLVEKDGDGQYRLAQWIDGRDMVFLPNATAGDKTGSGNPQALVVSRNGGSVTLWQRKETTEALDNSWQKVSDTSCRPIFGVETGASQEDFVELRQFVIARFQNQVALVALASRSSGRFCLVAGPLVAEEGLNWIKLLPNTKEDSVLWFDEREQVSLVVPLPEEGSIRGGMGVATNQRILVVSSDLKILATTDCELPPGSLVPLGSFTVAYASHMNHRIRYLSGLPETFGRSGVIANFPITFPSYYTHWLAGIRPDRIIYHSHHNGTRLVERGRSSNSFLLPLATTRPTLLLEPMIANAIATGGKEAAEQPFLRSIVEKFGRKVATMSHGEEEGIGNFGAGITPKVFELLEYYNLKSAASWLLTGTISFDRSANSRLLPPYLPITAKTKAALDADTHLHLIASGDQYFTEYVKSPDNNMSSALPRPTDPVAMLCQHYAMDAIKEGKVSDAVKMLDIAGTERAGAMMLQLTIALQLGSSRDTKPIVDTLFQQDSHSDKVPSTVASLAALATELKTGKTPSSGFNQKWLQSLAPSVQRSRRSGRHRSRLVGESSLSGIAPERPLQDKLFSKEIPESKLVWNEGPNREKENLLVLDNIQEWLGRKRPVILGREGAKSAEERGASTLAGILNSNDEDSFGGENDDAFKDGWVDGVGEGLKDEDKLSAYFRFSEGEEDDASWLDDGFKDITKFDNIARIVGNPDDFNSKESTSSVDEGESGKVKALYDLVFSRSGVGQISALAIPAARGGSLDLGVMHGHDHVSRQKCTIEFWVWVPESIEKDMILIRRTFGSSANDFDVVCEAGNGNFLWELGLQKNGELEFRTIAGNSLKTKAEEKDDGGDTPASTVHFSRWNHICIIMKQESITSSAVSLFVRGGRQTDSKTLSFSPPDFEADNFSGASAFDPMLEKSHLLFGLDHAKDLRITELRVWALDRKDDDIKTWMTEYLECAEIKRKFKIKIKKKLGAKTGIGLVPPKGFMAPPGGTKVPGETRKAGLLAPPGGLKPPNESPKGGLLGRPGGLKPPNESANRREKRRSGLLELSQQDTAETRSTPEKAIKVDINFETSDFNSTAFGNFKESPTKGLESSPPVTFPTAAFGVQTNESTSENKMHEEDVLNPKANRPMQNTTFLSSEENAEKEDDYENDAEEIEISPLWDSAVPLSEQVRTSAASALIRGPPATRHFGGNRGGLPDYRELERFGVGAISICGSEKTIVWRDDQVPPGLTYPIGASGAIVSDQMDGDGSEFLCCFMAKDKRMVVFELSTRTIVVELQMTTKLNYWRFLPPEAGEDTLCFMLITPVGGFHWMPLDESPRPRQVWKRGTELQGKKIVSYEEGGTNGFDGPDMLSTVGLLLVTNSSGKTVDVNGLEAWLVPICGDSQVVCASYEILGACLCQPPGAELDAFMPLMVFVVEENEELIVCVSAVTQEGENSIGLTDVMTDALIEQGPYRSFDFEPPTLAMGTYPEVLCCSLGSTVVVIVRRKGIVAAFELGDSGLELIAQENVGQYVVDAVMRYNSAEGGAEIVLLMSDANNRRDGRVGTFCFRAAC
eukprot:CAMPEP_0172360890 /NCGR_PEP_ID=MMETSP1060-20121228/4819_1 /TAXON_ID=37318 /ORGANISM="Pseudo-nitzschia pungens, Strain cf. cingulata" /LENGTH=2771 /DNA_ID=CAMNT_0013082989 /DNA_START=94 /DNA_END=8409 /DNA_ORIENTATION=+